MKGIAANIREILSALEGGCPHPPRDEADLLQQAAGADTRPPGPRLSKRRTFSESRENGTFSPVLYPVWL